MAQLGSFEYEYVVKVDNPVKDGDKRVVGWVFDSKEEALDKLGMLVDKHLMFHFDVCKSVKWPDEEEA